MEQPSGQMDAFSLLMMNAGRKQAAAGSKQTKRKPGTSASPAAKRARSSQDRPQPQSQEQQEQPATQDASSAQHTPAAAVDKQAALAAFKRAFSAGASSSRKQQQQFDNLLVYVSMRSCVSAL